MHNLIRSTVPATIAAQDALVRAELAQVEVPVESIALRMGQSVICSVFGKLSTFSFRRLSEAWEVSGMLPASAADEIRLHNGFGVVIKWPDWVKPGTSVTRIEVTSMDGLKLVAAMIRKHSM
jgi:hypothetical protein